MIRIKAKRILWINILMKELFVNIYIRILTSFVTQRKLLLILLEFTIFQIIQIIEIVY